MAGGRGESQRQDWTRRQTELHLPEVSFPKNQLLPYVARYTFEIITKTYRISVV